MRRSVHLLLAATITACLLGGCGGTGGGYASPRLSRRASTPSRPRGIKPNKTQYTVLLKIFEGPNHAKIATDFNLKPLQQKLRWKNLFTISQANHTDLYWGVFDSHEDARPTLLKARAHRTTNGLTPFGGAIITVIPGGEQDTAGFDISNNSGMYSLLIAEFEDKPDAGYVGRRQFANEYCRQLRDQGVEAWVHHGPRSSSVTVGSFGPDAVQTRSEKMYPHRGGRPILREVKDPVAPELLRMIEKFPHRAYNGREFYNVRKDRAGNVASKTLAPSEVIYVPGQKPQNGGRPRANHRSRHRQSW